VLIAEDLLLLLTSDDTGKLMTDPAGTDVALGGALLADLELVQRVGVAGPGERVAEGRLIVRDATPVGDDVLDDALATIGHREGEKAQKVVALLGKRTRARLYDRLTTAGLLRSEGGRILGMFPTHRWPAERRGHEGAVRGDLVTALREGRTEDARTRALLALLLAVKAVHKAVAPESVELSKQELTARAERIAGGEAVGKAVRAAIENLDAAIIAATTSSVVTGGAGGW
jgi:hypothetical protein